MFFVSIILLLKSWRKVYLIAIILSLSLITIISFNKDIIKKRMIDEVLIETNILDSESKISDLKLNFNRTLNIFSKNHQKLYKVSLEIFKDNPIIGVGPKMYREVCSDPRYFVEGGCVTHPHNTYIQLLAETGIVGTLPVIFALLFTIYKLAVHGWNLNFLSKIKLTNLQVCLYMSILITLWPFIPTGNFFHNWSNVIYFLPIGFLLNSYNKNIH